MNDEPIRELQRRKKELIEKNKLLDLEDEIETQEQKYKEKKRKKGLIVKIFKLFEKLGGMI